VNLTIEYLARRRVRMETDDHGSNSNTVTTKWTTSSGSRDSSWNAAARGMGAGVAVACAATVVGVAVLAVMMGGVEFSARASDRDFDRCTGPAVQGAVLVAGAIGVVVAGGIGWWTARRVRDLLDRARSVQRRFVAEAGHELRTPVTILYTRLQLLVRRAPLDDPWRTVIEELLNDARVLAAAVDDLLGQRRAHL
jgi:two-component system OmpR family sensor kinase